MENKEQKISTAEAIIAGLWLFVLPDSIELLLTLLGLDDFWISDMFAFPGSMIYLKIKDLKNTFCLISNIIELIPYAGALPNRTIGFVVTVILENYKNKTQQDLQTTEKIAKVAKVIPAAKPYAEILEKGTKITKKTIDSLDKLNTNNFNIRRINLPKSFQINNSNSLYFKDPELKQKILPNNIAGSIRQEKINIKNIPRPTNIDVEKLNKKDYNKIELDDSKNIINLKNEA